MSSNNIDDFSIVRTHDIERFSDHFLGHEQTSWMGLTFGILFNDLPFLDDLENLIQSDPALEHALLDMGADRQGAKWILLVIQQKVGYNKCISALKEETSSCL